MSTFEYPAKPTLPEVAALLRARTLDKYGNELAAFTSDTRPTDVQAQEVIDSAYNLVILRVGRIDAFSTEIIDQAKSVTALLAARLIETVYYPEQATQEQSAASIYGEMYEAAIDGLEQAIKDNRATTTTGYLASIKLSGLAAATEEDWPINWEQMNLDEPWT